MALGNTNISITAVSTELGISTGVSRTWTYLTSYSGINKYARYAPGALSVDGSKNTVVTPPASNMKIGDFRSYNHASNAPSLSPPSLANYIGTGNMSFQMGILPNAMNIWSYADPAETTSYKLYKNATDRGNEVSPLQVSSGSQVKDLTFSTTTIPVGHSRTSTKVVGSTQTTNVVQYNPVTNAFSTPNQTLYGDAYLGATITGARKINMGDAVADGYFDFVAHQQTIPYITATGNITPAPPGWTAAWIDIHTSSSPVCTVTSNINQSPGGTSFSFYVKILGIDGAAQRTINTTDCNVYLTHDGGKQLIYSGSIPHNIAEHMTGTLQASNTWSYDEVGYVTIESVTFGTSETTC